MSPNSDTPESEEKFDLDGDVSIADELSGTEFDTPLSKMIPRAAKDLENDQTEQVRSVIFRFKDIWRVSLTNGGPARRNL